MEKKILVTGATGNIGSEIVRQLKAKNEKFVAGIIEGEAIEGVETIKLDFADKLWFPLKMYKKVSPMV